MRCTVGVGSFEQFFLECSTAVLSEPGGTFEWCEQQAGGECEFGGERAGGGELNDVFPGGEPLDGSMWWRGQAK